MGFFKLTKPVNKHSVNTKIKASMLNLPLDGYIWFLHVLAYLTEYSTTEDNVYTE